MFSSHQAVHSASDITGDKVSHAFQEFYNRPVWFNIPLLAACSLLQGFVGFAVRAPDYRLLHSRACQRALQSPVFRNQGFLSRHSC